ncbi:MAG: hypothetical protein PF904_02485 [Kiritimatiellae bacterium]|jgi:rhamnogalacturonan endolyase|nr:hypothetical protein [Kiritimatiellia bacterium]
MRIIIGIYLLASVLSVHAEDVKRISNPGFEDPVVEGKIPEWGFFVREKGKFSSSQVKNAAVGDYAARLVHKADRDWAFINKLRTSVKGGQFFEVRCRMKRMSGGGSARLTVVGYSGKKLYNWSIGATSSVKTEKDGWREYRGFVEVPESVDTIYLRYVGNGKIDVLVDDAQMIPREKMEWPKGGAQVNGWVKERRYEKMNRGVVALKCDEGVYVGWRLLEEDKAGTGFDVYRELDGNRVKCNKEPVVKTTDFIDREGADVKAVYSVETAEGFKGPAGSSSVVKAHKDKESYISVPISDKEAKAHKVGIADLDGDGIYDYVIKHPGGNVDPWIKYWYKSPETYKIEARLADGKMLWIKDLGWNIERGTWYSPIVVADLDGDGRAEVAAKIGPDKDMRDEEGKVQKGEEWVAVYNGMTGKEIARAPWPDRDEFGTYNHASRNQIAVAYLDGKTPCLITLRGTYGLMMAEAWMLEDGKLKELWKFSNNDLWGPVLGQGAHSCLCVDVDLDGRDEIVLGSMTLDDDGSVLWSTGKGHPDAHYYGDIDPKHPGMEIAYVIETRQQKEGGLNVIDALTGKFLWQLQGATRHVHSRGICSDLDVMHLGMEVYGADADNHKLTEHRWLMAADGTIIREGTDVNYKFGVSCAWWDADLQRELIRGRAMNYDGGNASGSIKGSFLQVADVIGDWREEVICTEKGEVRIYTTRIPAMDRRVCLMQDDPYRMRTVMNAMGYEQTPTLSYLPAARSLNVNLTVIKENDKEICRVVVQASLDKGYKGEVKLQPPMGRKIEQKTLAVDLKPGEMLVKKYSLME